MPARSVEANRPISRPARPQPDRARGLAAWNGHEVDRYARADDGTSARRTTFTAARAVRPPASHEASSVLPDLHSPSKARLRRDDCS